MTKERLVELAKQKAEKMITYSALSASNVANISHEQRVDLDVRYSIARDEYIHAAHVYSIAMKEWLDTHETDTQ